MSQTIRRGNKSVRKAAAANGKSRTVRKARNTTGGLLSRLFGMLPFSERGLQRLFMALILAAIAGAAWLVASVTGLTDAVETRIARSAADAGLVVRHVEVRGVDRMDKQDIYARAIKAQSLPMPELDVSRLRDELVSLSWVKDARVSRQLPDTLVIDIVERVPHAVLRQGEEFVLIDPSGHRLEPVPRGKAEKMLVLSGDGAADRAGDLSRLLGMAPALKPRVRGAEWVGHRRWNLTFDSGQVVALPEGEAEAGDALLAFATMDGANGLLGGKVAVFDMRGDDRIYMRVPGRAEEEARLAAERKRAEAEAARKAEGG